MGKLEGKVALITGAARGFGAEAARVFAKEGAAVVLGDIIDEAGAAVAQEIQAAGGRARYFHLDVSQEDDWRRVVDESVKVFGKLDILVNNAGIVPKEIGRAHV